MRRGVRPEPVGAWRGVSRSKGRMRPALGWRGRTARMPRRFGPGAPAPAPQDHRGIRALDLSRCAAGGRQRRNRCRQSGEATARDRGGCSRPPQQKTEFL